MKITLPWPDRRLFPNARRGKRLFDTSIISEHRGWANLAARNRRFNPIIAKDKNNIYCHIKFFPPDRRKRDLDGMLSACKPYLDGIADALGINDRQFNPIAIERLEPKKNGEVVIEL